MFRELFLPRNQGNAGVLDRTFGSRGDLAFDPKKTVLVLLH